MTSPTSPTNGNGNGNGNGLTQKEMLLSIDRKLDSLVDKVEGLRLDFAVHEGKAHHDGGIRDIDDLKHGLATSRTKLAAYAGGIAVGVFAIELAARFLK